MDVFEEIDRLKGMVERMESDNKMIFRTKKEELIEAANEETDDREQDKRILNDIKMMQMQIDSDIRLLKNSIAQLEAKYGIEYTEKDYYVIDND